MLKINQVSKSFARGTDTIQVLERFTLEVATGETATLQGPSGCGKTTLLLIASGLLKPDAGRVEVDGQSLYNMDAGQRADLRAAKIGIVFQQFHLMPYLSVLENIQLPAVVRPSCDRDRAEELASRFGLQDRLRHRPAELSIGERQRTAFARALFSRPACLMADEPTANLDDANATIVLDAVEAFARNGGCVLLVSHDARSAERANRVISFPPRKVMS